MSDVFKKIDSVARERGLSICKLEREAGLAKGAVGKWRTSSPTVDNLKAVAKVLETTVDELLAEE